MEIIPQDILSFPLFILFIFLYNIMFTYIIYIISYNFIYWFKSFYSFILF